MKNLLTTAFLLFAVSAFAQDSKKDTVVSGSTYDYGARMYDPRIVRYAGVNPQHTKDNSPYKLNDTAKQVADKKNISVK